MGSKDHKKLLNDFNNQIKKLNQNEDEKEKYVKVMKDRLKETNDELKRYIERDKRNNILIKKKNEEF